MKPARPQPITQVLKKFKPVVHSVQTYQREIFDSTTFAQNRAMKRCFLFLFSIWAIQVQAQRAQADFIAVQNDSEASPAIRESTDTLVPLSFVPVNQGGLGCFTGFYQSDSGFVSGNNNYGDLEKAQFFSLSKSGYQKGATLQAVQVKFAYKTVFGGDENIAARIWSCDSGVIDPGELMATSNPVLLSQVVADGHSTVFTFAQPVTVTDSFFVSITLPVLTGDTLVILSTDDGCVAENGYSWELWSNNTWHSLHHSWVRTVDLAIFPVAEVYPLVGIAGVAGRNEWTVYPNPAGEVILLKPEATNNLNQWVEIKNQLGLRFFAGDVSARGITIDVSAFPSGIYFIDTPGMGSSLVHRLVIQR